jgi:membrane protein implicated in regulation of membrane protease activity
MPDWIWWVVAALVLAAIEIVSLDLIFGMVAVGAVAGAIAAALGANLVVQVLVASVTAVLLLFAVRPVALRHLRSSPQSRTNIDALVGGAAVVLQRVDRSAGLVKIGGEDWSARALRPDSSFEPGEHLTVIRIDGATAVVDSASD